MLKQRIFILSILSALFLTTACNKKVLSEKQMEDVLYDIHIADAEISDNYRDFREDEKKRELFESVFKKHGITQEQFDTSLVWYGRRLDKFLTIYDNVDKRYTALSDSINAKIERLRKPVVIQDTNQIYIWESPKTLILSSLLGENTFAFNLDTIQLSTKEYYEFKFNILGIADSIVSPSVTFGLGFPDSAFVKRKTVSDNGLFTISISPADSIDGNPFRIFGSIRIAPQEKEKKVVIYDIGLYKSTIEINPYENKEELLDNDITNIQKFNEANSIKH